MECGSSVPSGVAQVRLFLPISIFVLLGFSWSTASALRTIAVDSAGSFFPSREANRTVRFGSSSSAQMHFSGSNTSECETVFCLEVALASAFDVDPFILAGYNSRYSIESSSFDSFDPDTMRPVVAGDDNLSFRTVWEFETDYQGVGSATPTIDLLLRLRQTSQMQSTKDQLLLNIRSQLTDTHSVKSIIDTYSMYGNARVRHRTRRVGSNAIRVSFAISKDILKRDVIVEDAYPLVNLEDDGVPTSIWWYTLASCQSFTAALFNCTVNELRAGSCDYSSTQSPLIECLRSERNMTSEWFANLQSSGVNSSVELTSDLSPCLHSLWVEDTGKTGYNLSEFWTQEWWSAAKTLSWLAFDKCPFGPFPKLPPDDRSNVTVLSTPSNYQHDIIFDSPTFTGVFEIRLIGYDTDINQTKITTSQVGEEDTSTHIASVLAAKLGQLVPGGIHVVKEYSGNQWKLNVTFNGLMLPHFSSVFLTTSPVANEESKFTSFSTISVQKVDVTTLTDISPCEACELVLSDCMNDISCQKTLPCIYSELKKMTKQKGNYDGLTGKNRMRFLSSLEKCVTSVALSDWKPIAEALVCSARFRCNLGANAYVDKSDHTLLRLQNGFQILPIYEWVYSSNDSQSSASGSGKNSIGNDTISNHTSLQLAIASLDRTKPATYFFDVLHHDDLEKFLKQYVLHSVGDVKVEKTVLGEQVGNFLLNLTYSNYLLSDLPEVTLDGTVAVINYKPAEAFIEYSSDQPGPFLDILIGRIQTLISSADIDSAADDLSSWSLAPECLLCSIDLFECPVSQVKDYTCSYNRPSSPFARYLHQQLVTAAFANLTQAGYDIVDPVSITAELEECFKRLATNVNPTEAKLKASKALACFAKSECPFGPLSQVTNMYQVEIDSTKYVQVIRIRAAQFDIGLLFKIGGEVFATYSIDSEDRDYAGDGIRSVLQSSGIDVTYLRFDQEFDGRETTITIHYSFVMLPDFSVSISNASTPSPRTFVDNMVLPSSMWIKQAPRLPSKVFQSSESSDSNSGSKSTSSSLDGSHSHGSSKNDSINVGDPSGSSEESGSTSTDSPINTIRCQFCKEFLTDGCRGSEFCQMNILPCVANSLAMSYASIVNVSVEVDVRSAIVECITDASTSSKGAFYSWFTPLQNYFSCMAREKCPTHSSDGTSIPSTLRMVPGAIDFVYTSPSSTSGTASASSFSFSLEIWQEGPGTSFPASLPYAFEGDRSELVSLLQYMTLGDATNITVDVSLGSSNGDDKYHVRIKYGDDFIGYVPIISGQLVTDASTIQPKMVVQPKSSSFTDSEYDWGALREQLLEAAGEDTSAVSCYQCSHLFVTECITLSSCRQTLVPCLLNRIPDARELQTHDSSYGTDTSLTSAIISCTSAVNIESSRVFLHFLKCYGAHQCLAGSSSTSSTYLLTTPARQRFRRAYGQGSVTLDTELSAIITGSNAVMASGNVLFEGTMSELRTKLQEMSPAMSMKLWMPSDTSRLGAQEFELEYVGLVGSMPSLSISPSSSGYWEVIKDQSPNTLLFTSDNTATLTRSGLILSTLSGVVETAQDCSSVCEEHLVRCAIGNSQLSLNCREGVLVCVYNTLISQFWMSLLETNGRTNASLSQAISSCTEPYTAQVLEPFEQFFSCYNDSGCPANHAFDDGVPPSYLTFSSANHFIQVHPRPTPDLPVTLTVHPPKQTDSRYFALNGTAEGLEGFDTFIEGILNNTAVDVSFKGESTTIGSTYAEYLIDYQDYLGVLPTIDGIVAEKDAEVTFWSTEPWEGEASASMTHLFWERLAPHVSHYGVFSCIDDVTKVMSCIPCRKIVLPCLLEKLTSTIDYSSGEFTLVNDGTGVEFSYAVRMCAVGLTFPEWALVGDMMKCFMDYRTYVNTGVSSIVPEATYVMMEDAKQIIRAQDKDVIELQVSFVQEGSQVDFNSPGYVTISLDRTNNYAALSDLLTNYLKDAGASVSVSGVTKYDAEFGEILQIISINYTNFYGYPPGFGSPVMEDIRGVAENAAKFTLQALGASSPTWSELNGGLAHAVTTKALTGICATHMAKLLSCKEESITDGTCTFDHSVSQMGWCLRTGISWSSILTVIRTGNVEDVTTPIMDCLALAGSNEASQSKAPEGWWYHKSDALGGLERDNCPFGQLGIAITDTSMTRLSSAMHGQLFTFYSPSGFNVTLSVNYQFSSSLTTTPFTETTTNDELAGLISAIVPPTAQVLAMMMQTDVDTWTIQVVYSRLYVPSPVFQLDAGSATVTTQSLGDWQVMLQLADLDTSTFVSLF